MEVTFAPSIANLFMAQWEEQVVLQLILYCRFIDDSVIIWKGDKNKLSAFLSKLNNKQKSIILS